MKNIRILFVCKKRSTYGVSYGLLNSCRFLVNALVDMGFEATVVEVNDNNDIDREITQYRATHVFIEALWVVPEKFNTLIPLHPNVKWFVRLHSNVPFISCEGMAIDWIVKYFALGVKFPQFKVAPNSARMVEDLEDTYGVCPVFAPNIYMPSVEYDATQKPTPPTPTLDIGCFGAIRPLKNQLIQAMAAVAFANKIDRQMTFHINGGRIEGHGDAIYRNIQALFATSRHKLEIHEWLNHPDFMNLVRSMDLGMQVSLSETFDIVAADFAYANVPVVGSTEIEWLSPLYKANCTDMEDIVCHLEAAWVGKKYGVQVANRQGLRDWNEMARKAWKRLLK